MDQPSFLSRSGPIALSNIFNTEQKILLPLPAHQKPRLRVRALLSHCLYRRVILWTVGILVLLCILLTQGGARLRGDRFLNLVEYQQDGEDSNGDPKVVFVVTAGSEKPGTPAWGINMPNWLRFRQWVSPQRRPRECLLDSDLLVSMATSPASRLWYPVAITSPSIP